MKHADLEVLMRRVIEQRPYSKDIPPNDEVFANYIAGNLSEAETKELESYLESDPELHDSLAESREALEWFRNREPKLKRRLTQHLESPDGRSQTVTIEWSALISNLDDSVRSAVRSMLDAVGSVAGGEPSLQPAPAYRSADAEEISTEILPQSSSSSFAIVRAEIEPDGRCIVELSTSNQELWRTDDRSYFCSLELVLPGFCLTFEDARIDRRGNVSFIVNLSQRTPRIRLNSSLLRLKACREQR